MRLLLTRGAPAAALLLAAVAGAPAQPPAPPTALDKLKADTAALAAERAGIESAAAERARLLAELKEQLKRLDRIPQGPMQPPAPPNPPAPKKDGPTLVPAGVDRLREATNLVRSDRLEAALNAFRQIPPGELDADDRAFVRYMTAACLRRLGRPADALPIYREVGDAGEEPFIASSAVSQVALLRTAEELQAQLLKLRERPKSR